MKKQIWSKILILIGILIFFCGWNYFLMIPLNLRYTGTFLLLIVFLVITISLFSQNLFEKKYITLGKEVIETKVPKKGLLYLSIGGIVLVVVYLFSSSPIFFSKQYQELIGTVEEKNFTEDFSLIENPELPIVDKAYAEKLGDKKLGSDRGLGSEYHVGEFSDIVVDGKMMMVAPLEFNGFFKWLNNKTAPGYVTVDKITGNVELVTTLKEKKLALKYLPTSYFNTNLKRHAYFNGNMDNEIVQTTFELDDEGNPYFVLNKIHKTIGIHGGEDIKSVIVVDAQTGEVKEYEPSNAPSWVDTIYPKDLIIEQLNDWGKYVHGFFNTLFSEKDVVKVTPGTRRVYNDNNLYHFTGMTSNGADESTVGFAFVNTKTKATTFYKMVGATENAAMKSAEGKVENFGYSASFPLPLNIQNVPSFFIPLKDSTGLIKQYAFVNIEDYSIVGNGDTITDALNSYLKSINKDMIPTDKTKDVSGTISRFGTDVHDGTTYYYLMLNGDKTLYYGTSVASKTLSLTKAGDKVKMSVSDSQIVKFQNLELE